MDRLSAMELFVLSIDEGSLSAGARRLGRPPAAATRAVSMLEEETSETLLIRSTRRIALTAAGQHWLDIWRGVLTQLAAGRTGPEPGGKITITAPDLFGRTWVQPIVEEFFRKHSKVNTRLLLLNRAVDLLEEGVDLAIRVGALPDNGVTAARLGQVHNLLCASPKYVEKRGQPRSPADLRHHDCIGTADGSDVWQLNEQRLGKIRPYTVPLRFSVDNGGAVLEAILRGVGIGWVMSCQALPHLDSGHLVSLMPDRATGPIPVHLVFRGHPPRSGTVRDFVNHAVPLIRQRLSEVEAAIAPIIAGRSGARHPSRQAVAG